MDRCTIIGISDSREQWFPPEVMEVIACGKVFSGGKRHHEIMASMLPKGTIWIDIIVPLSRVFEEYTKYDDIVIFASGDPLFYGFANTVQRELPECKMKVYPSFNSLQMLAHRMNLPYQDMHVVSLTGRPWAKFDEAIIKGEQLIGVLTDRKKTPQVILQRMLDYGYDNYTMTVGENLGNKERERVAPLPPRSSLLALTKRSDSKKGEFFITDHGNQTVMPRQFDVPNCIILQRRYRRKRPFGIPESDFALLDGRAKMITKMPIRLVSLAMLNLRDCKTFWDVGFCTGSVSIEAKLQFPHLEITAFEVREEGRKLMEENSKRFGTPCITTVIGDFLAQDLSQYPRPDAVFIGGHGGKLMEMMEKIYPLLNDDGVVVMNSVTEASYDMFIEAAKELGMKLAAPMHIALNDFNPITILKALKQVSNA